MTDTLRDRIAAVLREHVEDQLTNYDAGRNECGCGNQGLSGYVEHVADAVIAELDWEWGIQYHAVPSGVVLGRDENPDGSVTQTVWLSSERHARQVLDSPCRCRQSRARSDWCVEQSARLRISPISPVRAGESTVAPSVTGRSSPALTTPPKG